MGGSIDGFIICSFIYVFGFCCNQLAWRISLVFWIKKGIKHTRASLQITWTFWIWFMAREMCTLDLFFNSGVMLAELISLMTWEFIYAVEPGFKKDNIYLQKEMFISSENNWHLWTMAAQWKNIFWQVIENCWILDAGLAVVFPLSLTLICLYGICYLNLVIVTQLWKKFS